MVITRPPTVTRRGLVQIAIGGVITLQGCLEWISDTEDENVAVLIVNNLTRELETFELTVRGAEDHVLHETNVEIEAGKGYRTETFPDEIREIKYVVDATENGSVEIPPGASGESSSRLTKYTISYTTEGMRYEE